MERFVLSGVIECRSRAELQQGHCMVTRGHECAVVQKSWFGTLCLPLQGWVSELLSGLETKNIMYCGLCDVVLSRGSTHPTKLTDTIKQVSHTHMAFLFIYVFSYLSSSELIYLLICILCGDVVSITDYTGWNFTFIKGQLIGKYVNGSGRCRFQSTTRSCASCDEENHEGIQWRQAVTRMHA